MAQDWQQQLLDGFMHMSGWEAFAALLGLGYIIYAARESQWCWPLAFVSTLIYTVLFWEGQLPMQALLNFYYMGMAVYGYWLWRQHGKAEDNLPISSWSWPRLMLFVLTGGGLSWLTAHFILADGLSQSPYLDASVTIFSVMNTWLMARKIIQNWINWVVIDAAAILLYVETGYYATALLFAIYTVLAAVGYLNWRRLYRQQTAPADTAIA